MTWRVGGGKSWEGHGDLKPAGEASLSEGPGGAHMRQQDVLGGASTTCKAQGAAGAEGGARGSCSCVTGSDHGGTLPFLGNRRSHGKVLSRELMASLWLCNSLLVAKWRKMCAGGGGSVGARRPSRKLLPQSI